ncbi:MAG: peptidylprolyl isomerase [Halieaceae bacterium]
MRQTDPMAYEASISRPRASYRVLENLYVLKRVKAISEQSSVMTLSELEYLVEDIYRRTLLERYLSDGIGQRMAAIDWEGLAAAEYAQRKDEFVRPEEVRVEHLLVGIEEVPFDEFVSKVTTVRSLIQSGADFQDLISTYSDDPSAERNGGDLGFFTSQRMQPTFSAAAFSLIEPGDMTGPVMTRFGAHFIRLIERRPEETMTFESVSAALIKEVKKSTEARLREELLSEFRAEIEPNLAEIDEAALVMKFIEAHTAELTSDAPN